MTQEQRENLKKDLCEAIDKLAEVGAPYEEYMIWLNPKWKEATVFPFDMELSAQRELMRIRRQARIRSRFFLARCALSRLCFWRKRRYGGYIELNADDLQEAPQSIFEEAAEKVYHTSPTREERRLRRVKRAIWLVVFAVLIAAALIAFLPVQSAQSATEAEPVRTRAIEPVPPETFSDRVSGENTPAAPQRVLHYIGQFYVTGYDICESCCKKTDGITASTVPATVGRTVAADRSIPFGTVLYIDGIGDRVVEDRGVGAGCLDVLCEDHAACYAITGEYEVYVVEGA